MSCDTDAHYTCKMNTPLDESTSSYGNVVNEFVEGTDGLLVDGSSALRLVMFVIVTLFGTSCQVLISQMSVMRPP